MSAVDVPQLFRRALGNTHRFDGAFLLELREAARKEPAALFTEMQRLPTERSSPARAYPAWLLARHVEHTLATTPGIEPAAAALRLAIRAGVAPSPMMLFAFDDDARRRWILARLAVRQTADVAIELLERFEESPEGAPILPLLTQELITRNRVRSADHPVVRRLIREMRGRESPYAWLPEELLPIEAHTVFPAIDDAVFMPHARLPPLEEPETAPVRWPWGSQTLHELDPPACDVAWPRPDTQLELRAFQLPPGSAGVPASGAIASLPLDCLAPPSGATMRTRTLAASEAFALLFHAAAVEEGWASGFASWPRLVAWKLLSTLAGSRASDSPEDIQRAASALEWTRVGTRDGWFDQVDLGWAMLVAARDLASRRIRVLAAARVEPRT